MERDLCCHKLFLSPPVWEDLEFPVARGRWDRICMRPCLSISSEQKVACGLEHMGKVSPRQYRNSTPACNRCSKATQITTNRHMDIMGVHGHSQWAVTSSRVFMVSLSHCCLSKIKQ